MPIISQVRPSEYHDSVTLMLAAKALREFPGISDAAVVMATPANRDILTEAGLWPEGLDAGAGGLLICVRCDDEAQGRAALARAAEYMHPTARQATAGQTRRPLSLSAALSAAPDANLVVISVGGRYAAREARTALLAGRHVLLFSDNVDIEDEIELKLLAVERGLLCMGPDAGTAIIEGVALGFANAVPRGPVGLIGATGTGLQAICCGLAARGIGISQAIGVGGRDLSQAVGGAMMLAALDALAADPETRLLVLASKPPAPEVGRKLLRVAESAGKPVVVCFLGSDREDLSFPRPESPLYFAADLTIAATVAAALAAGDDPEADLAELARRRSRKSVLTCALSHRLPAGTAWMRGLFAGGTLCYEAQFVLAGLSIPIRSNAPIGAATPIKGTDRPSGNSCIDLGADEFTQGRLHPMLDPTLRNRRIVSEARDPEVAILLLDIVLGYGAHPDPAGATAPAIREAGDIAAAGGRDLIVIASVCGTEADPQIRSVQERILVEAGAIVAEDNAAAALLAGQLLRSRPASDSSQQ